MNKHETRIKPQYVLPIVKSYDQKELLHQLGPARAYSNDRSADDALILFGTLPTGE